MTRNTGRAQRARSADPCNTLAAGRFPNDAKHLAYWLKNSRAMKPGDCAQTVLARTAIILHQVDDRPCYDLYPRRSFAPYLAAWLRDAMSRGLPS